MLRNDRDDFWMPQENLAHLSRGCLAVFKRQRGWHGGTNPEVAFFQMGRKLTAQPRRDQEKRSQRNSQFDSDDESAVSEREAQRGIVEAVQRTDNERFGFLHVLREE